MHSKTMFTASLFIIARTWKQPTCPVIEEWINMLWGIYTMKYYSTIKKNTFESVLMRQMNLEPIVQSEVSQKEKDRHHILTHLYGIQKDGTNDPACRVVKETDIKNKLLDTVREGGGMI